MRYAVREKEESRHAWLLLLGLGVLNLAGAVWMFTQPDDGSRGGRLHLTMTEWACLSVVTGTALVYYGLRKRRRGSSRRTPSS